MGVLLGEAKGQRGKEELLVRVLLLGVVVAHVLVDVVHVCAAVVALVGGAEGGATQQVAEVLGQMGDEVAVSVSFALRKADGEL